jgi:ubiquinone/menaquinone biosynthesis C-methylase UbiE
MNANDTGQVIKSAAEVYEEFFLPALFEQWAERVVVAAEIQPGDQVLDVACGTGVLARAAADRCGKTSLITGLDINEGMLTIAKRKAQEITWRHGKAESLPFINNHFDVVVSQFGLMFFENQQAAIQEMFRVLRPGGHLAIAVWDTLEHTPGYAAMTRLLQRLFGDSVADSLRVPYVLGNTEQLRTLFSSAGVPDVQIATIQGTARFPSIQFWVYTDIRGWTLADTLDEKQFDLLCKKAAVELQPFLTNDGRVAFDAPAHIITAKKPLMEISHA